MWVGVRVCARACMCVGVGVSMAKTIKQNNAEFINRVNNYLIKARIAKYKSKRLRPTSSIPRSPAIFWGGSCYSSYKYVYKLTVTSPPYNRFNMSLGFKQRTPKGHNFFLSKQHHLLLVVNSG